jgi:hypothetical protein
VENFVWESMPNYKQQREQFWGGFGPQGVAMEVQGTVENFELFFN